MKQNKFLTAVLSPFSWIYRSITSVRNFLYNNHVIKSYEFDVPVISVGNITVGGTGKTPHTEHIVEALKDTFDVTILSRGYKRKTKGFLWASFDSTVAQIGDEPKQMAQKFLPKVKVCVCEDRVKGIKKIIEDGIDNKVIVLDDAYQHRKVVPLINILLTDYSKPIYEDDILPKGRLRESAHNSSRANIIIVTKCPDEIKPIDRRIISKHLNLLPFQTIYFTNFRYDVPKLVFKDYSILPCINRQTQVVLLTGIANPKTLIEYINKEFSSNITHLKFKDHHDFSQKNIKQITDCFNKIPSDDKVILTTEKDAMRLLEHEFDENIKKNMFYLELKLNFVFDDEAQFNQQIIDNVTKDKTNYRLHTTICQF